MVAGFAAMLCGCGPQGRPVDEPAPDRETPAQAGYLAPPAVVGAQPLDGQILLTGQAAPHAAVRLATPQGEARAVAADAQGRWRLTLPPATEPRLFGLSMTAAGRVVQSQGYLLVTPQGRPVQLRAGAGALTLGAAGPPRITAFDFDADGGAVVSGVAAAPGAALSVRVDGRQMAEGRADDAGRFSVAFGQPLTQGRHALEVASEGVEHSAVIDLSPAAPLTGGPFRIGAAPRGVRVDWMTPGGGVQSTVLLG